MEWGGNYGAVEDIAWAPYLILNGAELDQLWEVQRQCAEHLHDTSPADRRSAEAAIDELYALAGLRAPRHVWLAGPARGMKRTWRSGEYNPPSLGGSLMFDRYSLGIHFSRPTGRTDLSKECERHWQRRLELWAALSRSCGGWAQYTRECRFYERPKEIHFKEGTRLLHRADGPALRYEDGSVVYAWNGDRVTADFVAGHLTWADWLRTNDLRSRSTFVDRMGWSWLLEHCPSAERLASDSEQVRWLLRGEDLGPLAMNFGSGRRMYDLVLVERIGHAKRNVSPENGQSLSAGPIEQISDDW